MRHPRAEVVSGKSRTHTPPAPVERLEERRLLASGDLGFAIAFGEQKAIDSGYSVSTDPSGNVYVTGTFQRSIDLDPTAKQRILKGGKDNGAFLVKYSPTGEFLWAKRLIGGPAWGFQVRTLPRGGAYVAVSYARTIYFNKGRQPMFTSTGGRDVLIMRFNSRGRMLWSGNIGGPKDDGVTAMAVGPDGDLYLGGWIRLNGDIDPTAGVNRIVTRGADDTFVMRVDAADGSLVWSKVYGEGSTLEEATGLAVDADGGVYVSGSFSREVQFDRDDPALNRESNGKRPDLYVGHLSDAGNGQARWDFVNTFGGNREDRGVGMALSPAGDALYVTGYFENAMQFAPGGSPLDLTGIGEWDGFVARFDADGQPVWTRQIGGDDAVVIAAGIATDGAGNVYTTGYFDETISIGGVELESDKSGSQRSPLARIRSSEVYIAKFTPAGNVAYARQIGGEDAGIMSTAIAADFAGNAFVTGNFNNEADLDPGPGVLIRKTDDRRKEAAVFLVKLLA